MVSLGPIAFAAPWLLFGLVLLPAIWLLLRISPPAPRLTRFPPIRLLRNLEQEEETPERSPLVLLLLRLLVGLLLVLAFAHPLLDPGARFTARGPLLIVLDNGWAVAPEWAERQRLAGALIDRAERSERSVYLLETAPATDGRAPGVEGPFDPAAARDRLAGSQPQPWSAARDAAHKALNDAALDGAFNVWWLSDGLDSTGTVELAKRLRRLGSLTVLRDQRTHRAHLQRLPESDGARLVIGADRAENGFAETVRLRGMGQEGRLLFDETLAFDAGSREARAALSLPPEVRNGLRRIEIAGEEGAGAVVLLDERLQRRSIGLATDIAADPDLPLLGELYYLERALVPFADVRPAPILDLLASDISAIVLPDVADLAEPLADALDEWVGQGGLLIRFAGPVMAEGSERLVPVRLRSGGRSFGGAMSWNQPVGLAPFAEESPFHGIRVPPDVEILRQVLAQPSPDLNARTWARLTDGTPIVTGARKGDGWIVLFHTTANPEWSNLSLSGLFVEMLRRLTTLATNPPGATEPTGRLLPIEALDGFGRLGPPPPAAKPIVPNSLDSVLLGPETPPGYYGDESSRYAVNIADFDPPLAVLDLLPAGTTIANYGERRETDLRPWLLTAALLLAFADLAISLALRGLLPWHRTVALAAIGLAGATIFSPAPGRAQIVDSFALGAANETRLAYVLTGAEDTDSRSRAGLVGLSDVLEQRTSVELGEPIGVDPARDELAFFPILYWPIRRDAQPLTPDAALRLNRFLRTGGMILFDTQDQQGRGLGGGATLTSRDLRRLLHGLNLPPIEPVPDGHVLTKSFYLLEDFPGRWAGGQIWVEASEGGESPVSSVIVGANDWASAWAVDTTGRPLYPTTPGGEGQREMAYRFGVNFVMYALTGNYKADQVHIPAILERLGQ
ncbi:MAG: DUF4159 domain-containing protein [Proteobacteria bacterium]|nr:DUF4159 domain-containing protein [Pseudomonadota bacterium]